MRHPKNKKRNPWRLIPINYSNFDYFFWRVCSFWIYLMTYGSMHIGAMWYGNYVIRGMVRWWLHVEDHSESRMRANVWPSQMEVGPTTINSLPAAISNLFIFFSFLLFILRINIQIDYLGWVFNQKVKNQFRKYFWHAATGMLPPPVLGLQNLVVDVVRWWWLPRDHPHDQAFICYTAHSCVYKKIHFQKFSIFYRTYLTEIGRFFDGNQHILSDFRGNSSIEILSMTEIW